MCQELCQMHYHMYYFIYFLQLNEIGAISTPILQTETLRLRKGRQHVQGYAESKQTYRQLLKSSSRIKPRLSGLKFSLAF